MIKISVVIPVYQAEAVIGNLLESVQSQTFLDFEALFIDDGSKDKTPEILDRFCVQDDRYHVFHRANGGPSAARNAGLRMAQGQYIYFVDADDWLEKDALEKLWDCANRTHADVIYGDVIIERDGRQIPYYPFPSKFYTEDADSINEIQCALNNMNFIKANSNVFKTINCIGGAPWRAMFKHNIAKEHDIFYNETLKTLGEDILFWQQIYEHVNSVAYTKSLIYHYRETAESLCHGYKSNLLDIFEGVFKTQIGFLTGYKKGQEHWEAFYFRVLLYIDQAMLYYFVNTENHASRRERYKAFKKMISKSPYINAIREVHVSKYVSNKKKIKVLLLRLGLTRLYWLWYEKHQ